jgi:hypothetical protein
MLRRQLGLAFIAQQVTPDFLRVSSPFIIDDDGKSASADMLKPYAPASFVVVVGRM